MRTVQKLILVALAALSGEAALADGRPVYIGPAIGPVAEWTGDDRGSFRERWREMSPQQRDAVRSRLRQEWQNVPPEERQQRSQQVFDQMRNREPQAPGPGWRRDRGYGQGYGTRPWGGPNEPGQR